MNYRSLLIVVESVVGSYGYHPTLPENLHTTLRHEGFPIAIITPPRLISLEGEKEVNRVYALDVKLLMKRGMSPAERSQLLAALASDAELIVKAIAEHNLVRELELQELAPIEEMLTISGEVALQVRAKARCFACEN